MAGQRKMTRRRRPDNPSPKAHDREPCRWCQRTMDLLVPELRPTHDHYPIPRSQGGRVTVIACYTCNNIKGNLSADQWHAYMDAHPEWWLRRNRPKPRYEGLQRVLSHRQYVNKIAAEFNARKEKSQ